MGYGVAMFRLLLLISCLGFVISCGDESVSEPTAAEPTVAEPTVAEPTIVEPRVWVGDVNTVEDLNRVGSYTEITGDLWIQQINDNLTSIDLPHLQTIGGYFWIEGNDNLTTITLPQLQSVGDGFVISNSESLTSIDLPHLQTIVGYIVMPESPQLTDCDLGSFTEQLCP